MHCSLDVYFIMSLFGLIFLNMNLVHFNVQFYGYIAPKLELVNMKVDFLNRNVNEGFSGGEKKRNEILQLAVLPMSCIPVPFLLKDQSHRQLIHLRDF